MGLERHEILNCNRNMVDSAERMAQLMQMVYWTRSNDTTAENYCFSDHFGTVAPDGTEITKSNYEAYKAALLDAGKTGDALTKEMLNTGEFIRSLDHTAHLRL